MRTIDLGGTWRCVTAEGVFSAHLPGTLDTNGIGHADLTAAPWHPDENLNDALASADVIATRFTRRFTYEGAASPLYTHAHLCSAEGQAHLSGSRALPTVVACGERAARFARVSGEYFLAICV